jgi:hypothetical protein
MVKGKLIRNTLLSNLTGIRLKKGGECFLPYLGLKSVIPKIASMPL